MDGIKWDWVSTSFGDLPAGTVFRMDKEDSGLFIKLESNASLIGNAVVIVSSRPGNPRYMQAGELTEFVFNTPVQAFVMEP